MLSQTNASQTNESVVVSPIPYNETENMDRVLQHDAALLRSTRDSLSWLIQRLSGFIYDDAFDIVNFSNQARSLLKELSQITHWVEVAQFENKDILRQLSFAKEMFSSMLEAAKTTSFYATDGPGQDLVSKLIQLNVRLFALYDYWGLPDIRQYAYVHTLYGLILKLDLLEKNFKQVRKIPAIVHLMFTSQMEQARGRVEFLAGYATQV
ncbi:hypothetical protein OY671_006160 [Metschnikowia pulcherrima]|nr:hypothetical protein OY671_006160 [Metschnikowia pulcherrima]